jgi:predicted outer membrane protein
MHRRQFLAGLMAATAPLAITGTALAQRVVPGAMPAPQYFAMASRGGTFLEEAARLGFEKTQDPRLRRFARAEVMEQVQLAANLQRNTDIATAAVPSAPSAAGGALVGAGVGALVAGPVGAVVGGAVGAGSSTAVGAGAAATSDAQKAAILGQLQTLPQGPQFDALFVQAQLMGHQEALAVHGGYAQAGDDPALRRVARNALPLIRLHIAQLAKLQGVEG